MPSAVEIPSRLPPAVAFVPLGGPQLVVLDSGVIYDDIVHRLRHPEKSHVLVASAQAGATRLFAGDHVYDEIYDRLDGHERRGITRKALLDCFERVYLPHLRFVATPRWPVADRVLPAAAADPDDVQTASLALLLAPSLVFAVDPHLVDAGFGRAEDWLTLAWQADELLGYDGALFAAGLGARAATSWVARLSRRVAADVGAREIALGLILGLGLHLAAPAASRAITSQIHGITKALGTAAGYTLLGVGQVASQSGQRHGSLRAASVAPDAVPSIADRIARNLATSNETASLSGLAAVVAESPESTARTLDEHPAFIANGRGWQLGRQRLPRGRELTSGSRQVGGAPCRPGSAAGLSSWPGGRRSRT